MKKLAAVLFLTGVIVFQFCSPAKKAQKEPEKTTYLNVAPVITANCSPCHVPPNGKRDMLNTYETAKSHIDDIIARIQKNPTDKGFMPFKHPKLPDSTIQVFVQWKNDGLLEK
jgi:hypothetical protein